MLICKRNIATVIVNRGMTFLDTPRRLLVVSATMRKATGVKIFDDQDMKVGEDTVVPKCLVGHTRHLDEKGF